MALLMHIPGYQARRAIVARRRALRSRQTAPRRAPTQHECFLAEVLCQKADFWVRLKAFRLGIPAEPFAAWLVAYAIDSGWQAEMPACHKDALMCIAFLWKNDPDWMRSLVAEVGQILTLPGAQACLD